MSRVKVIIEPDDDMTFGELEALRQTVAQCVDITGRPIMSEDGTIVISGILKRLDSTVDSEAH